MLRVADNQNDSLNPSNMSIDKKKRQVTLSEPSSGTAAAAAASATQERGPMVAAPKMFAFDNLFTNEDSQVSLKKLLTYLISLLVVLM